MKSLRWGPPYKGPVAKAIYIVAATWTLKCEQTKGLRINQHGFNAIDLANGSDSVANKVYNAPTELYTLTSVSFRKLNGKSTCCLSCKMIRMTDDLVTIHGGLCRSSKCLMSCF